MDNVIKVVSAGLILLLASCSNQAITSSVDQPLVNRADIFLTRWHKAASAANFDDYFNKMAEQSIFIGTDASENWTKQQFQAYSKPHFDKGAAWDFKTLERNIYLNESKDLIWFDELLHTWMGICRGSGVIAISDSGFKIKHYVLSLTIPNEDIDRVKEATQENNSSLLEKLTAGAQ